MKVIKDKTYRTYIYIYIYVYIYVYRFKNNPGISLLMVKAQDSTVNIVVVGTLIHYYDNSTVTLHDHHGVSNSPTIRLCITTKQTSNLPITVFVQGIHHWGPIMRNTFPGHNAIMTHYLSSMGIIYYNQYGFRGGVLHPFITPPRTLIRPA